MKCFGELAENIPLSTENEKTQKLKQNLSLNPQSLQLFIEMTQETLNKTGFWKF